MLFSVFPPPALYPLSTELRYKYNWISSILIASALLDPLKLCVTLRNVLH